MKKMTWLLSLLLAVSIIFSGCGEIPDEISSDISDSSSSIELTKPTESEQSIPDSEPEVSTDSTPTEKPSIPTENKAVSLSSIPAFAGSPYVAVNDNVPYFSDDDYTTQSYEYYSDLDNLGRCGIAMACIYGEDKSDEPESSETVPTTPSEPETVNPPSSTVVPEEDPPLYTEPEPDDEVTEMVWIPSSGSKYHSYSSCSNMKNPRQVTLEEAQSMGYTPCKRCH